MTRARNLTNKLGKKLRGSRYAYHLPEPVQIVSRESVLDNHKRRIQLALSTMVMDEIKSIEDVHVERIPIMRNGKSGMYFRVNFSGYENTEEAVIRICRIMDNRGSKPS